MIALVENFVALLSAFNLEVCLLEIELSLLEATCFQLSFGCLDCCLVRVAFSSEIELLVDLFSCAVRGVRLRV